VYIYTKGVTESYGKLPGFSSDASVGWVLSELPVKCQVKKLEPKFLSAVARSLITYGDRPERPWLTDLGRTSSRNGPRSLAGLSNLTRRPAEIAGGRTRREGDDSTTTARARRIDHHTLRHPAVPTRQSPRRASTTLLRT
jgi:hypothetical protein